jgi:ligand-binding sensor domain-containing protein
MTWGRLPLRIFNDQDGIPQNSIESVIQDHLGYIWIGTQDGLARYDGREWKVLALPHPTVTNWVNTNSLLTGSDGSLWVGSRGDGLLRYRNGAWTSFGPAEGFPDHLVTAVAESVTTSGSIIWAGTPDHGLVRIENALIQAIPPPTGHAFKSVLALAVLGRQLLVGTELGLFSYAEGRWNLLGDARSFGLASQAVSSILTLEEPGRIPQIWVGTEQGIAVLQGTAWTAHPPGPDLPGNVVSRLQATRSPSGRSVIWAATEGGLSRFENGRWSTFGMASGFPGKIIRSLLAVQGPGTGATLWVGTFGGLARFTPGLWGSFTMQSGLSENTVFTIKERAPGDYWMGTLGGGLNHFWMGQWSKVDRIQGVPALAIMAMVKPVDRPGAPAMIAGIRGIGLARLDGPNWTWMKENAKLPDKWVYALAETREDQGPPALWVGTRKGLVRIQGEKFEVFGVEQGLPHPHVTALLETIAPDRRRTLWIGTRGGGLASMDPDTRACNTYPLDTGFPGLRVASLRECRGPRGERFLWAATMGAGAARLDLDDPHGKWTVFNQHSNPPLASDTVYSVDQDRAGRIYLFSLKGVVRLTAKALGSDEPVEYSAHTFTTGDGLPSNGCTQASSYVDTQGRIWTGTVLGAAVFDPELEASFGSNPPLFIQEAWAGKAPLLPDEHLSFRRNGVMFSYALLSYQRERDIQYRVQLEGLNSQPGEWMADGKKE